MNDCESGTEGLYEWLCESGAEVLYEWLCESGAEGLYEWLCESGAEGLYEWLCESGAEGLYEWLCESGAEGLYEWLCESGVYNSIQFELKDWNAWLTETHGFFLIYSIVKKIAASNVATCLCVHVTARVHVVE